MLPVAIVHAEPTAQQTRFFETKVRPVLAEHCYKCHGPEKQKANLRLDSLAAMARGGRSGAAMEPGKPVHSLLIKAIKHEDADLKMPKDAPKLPAAALEAITEWVAMGAPWPGSAPLRDSDRFSDDDRRWWAIQPVVRPDVPKFADNGWSRNAIDPFVVRKLAENGMKPALEADRIALIRRVTLDLIGLPPTPQEIDAFVNDTSADAYDKVVDRLLASPHYGERWARHWLDLVRYADSDGYRADDVRPHIWRYRDYVVNAFNSDMPYDRFIREQIAGDEIAPDDPAALIATGYLRLGVYEWNQRDSYLQRNIILDDITAVTGDVFLGLSMACAQCHDHKFDPILQKDYYRLRAFFEPVLWRDDVAPVTPQQRAEHEAKMAQWRAAERETLAQIEQIHTKATVKTEKKALAYFVQELKDVYLKPEADRTPLEEQLSYFVWRQVENENRRSLGKDAKKKIDELNKTLAKRPAALPIAMTASDVGPVAPPTVIPGDRTNTSVAPGYLTILDADQATIEKPSKLASTGRRTTLAHWLASPKNPLTARVMVNRIWQQHFGRGIVATPSEFGHLGTQPTHPKMLDWLAAEFVERGWSVKHIHRLIVMSATYRQAADRPMDATAARLDPGNTLLWRANTRRLDAEQVRDAMLLASGELNTKLGGPTVKGDTPRRSIYVQRRRLTPDALLDAFDAADGLSSTATRNVTTTASQALLMINGPWPLRRAQALAKRIASAHKGDPAAQITMAYRLTFGRNPTKVELESSLGYLSGQTEVIADRQAAPPKFGVKPFVDTGRQAVHVRNGALSDRFNLTDSDTLPTGDFTVEAIVQLDTVYPDASVRAIASRWDASNQARGWLFGVTSERSKYTPRNLIVQLVGEAKQAGENRVLHEVLASGLHVELGRPYYLAVSVDLEDRSEDGVTFYLKDLSNPNARMRTARVEHQVVADHAADTPLVIGGRWGRSNTGWDGLIDEVRISKAALGPESLLTAAKRGAPRDAVIGHWRFEREPGVLADSSGRGNHLAPGQTPPTATKASSGALVDFCHLLLNSNEFLYVQ